MTELKDQLSLLGRKTEYKQDYAPEVLEELLIISIWKMTIGYVSTARSSQVCVPLPGQPDFAEIRISYIPEVKMVESKKFETLPFQLPQSWSFFMKIV